MNWDSRYAADGLLWTSQPNRFLVAEVEDLESQRALDVACGEGRNALWLAANGWQVTAVDSSEVGLGKGEALAVEAGLVIDWRLEDVTTFRPDPLYSLVAVLYLQLPRGALTDALVRSAGGLSPGGTLLVVGHHSDNIEHGIGGPQDPDLLYRPEDVVAMLPDLEIEKAETVRRPVHREGVAGIALDTLVRATDS